MIISKWKNKWKMEKNITKLKRKNQVILIIPKKLNKNKKKSIKKRHKSKKNSQKTVQTQMNKNKSYFKQAIRKSRIRI